MAERAKFVCPEVVPETAASSNISLQGASVAFVVTCMNNSVLASLQTDGGSAGPLILALKNSEIH